jgi:hypothetical protein
MSHVKKYTWRCALCNGEVELNYSIRPEQTISYTNSDGSVRSFATATAGVSGMEHTCPPGTLRSEAKR